MINATWHKAHPMPTRPTAQQRLRWHVAHAKVCGCRKLTAAHLRKLQNEASKAKPIKV